jgi:metal-dependent amidase/aminoacylase/carboxypeptidase family protein
MKSILMIALVTVLTTSAFGGHGVNSGTAHDLIDIQSDEIFDSLVVIRRDLYNHPEGSGREERTSRIIAEYLRGLGLEVMTEENLEGARAMMDDGLFDIIDPHEIYGVHIAPMPAGVIAVNPHEMYAYMRQIRIAFSTTLDQEAIERITASITRELSRVVPGGEPWELEHVLDPDIGMTNPDNMYRDYLIVSDEFSTVEKNGAIGIEMYIFETDKKNLHAIPDIIEEKIRATEFGDRLASVEYSVEIPTVVNDPELTEAALDIITGIYGDEIVIPMYGLVPFFNDDFAYFQERVPGVYFFMGGSNFEKGLIAVPHSPDYAVDEVSILYGVKYFSSLLIERVNRK